jgi:hypothetical protein
MCLTFVLILPDIADYSSTIQPENLLSNEVPNHRFYVSGDENINVNKNGESITFFVDSNISKEIHYGPKLVNKNNDVDME